MGGAANGSSNPTYGTAEDPKDPGSGGATINRTGGNGGGVIRVSAQSLVLDGSIRADGGTPTADSFAAGGSGGSIRIDVGTLNGAGQVTARGGNGLPSSGGGGGGRIAVYYVDASAFNLEAQISAAGGTGNGAPNGQNGTIHLQQQIAMLMPPFEETPVMTADVQENRVVQFASLPDTCCRLPNVSRHIPEIHALIAKAVTEAANADHPQRRVFSLDFQRETRDSKLETKHSNLYLALLAKHDHESRATSNDFDPIYTYDVNGNRASMIDPTGLTTYSYDALNRLTSITNNKGQTTTFTYDTLGRRTSMTHANGVVTSYSYDAASQLLALAHQFGATTIDSFTYAYDKVGNRKSKADNNGTANYTYDVLNRLTQAVNPLPSNPLESFTYDFVGNRTNSNQNGASTFNQANQLLEDANFTYQYDNNGNQTRKSPKSPGPFNSYEYDAENKLVRVVSNGTTVNYRYDGLGRRVEKEVVQVGTTVTRYVYDDEDILLELDGSNNIVARYTHGPGIDESLIIEKAGASFFYHADGLGSITEITDSAGMVKQRYTYSSFGKIDSQLDPNFIQPYTYTGREFDIETESYFYRTRSYDQATGRFLTSDPIGLEGGLNTYTYVENNPLLFTDPMGLDVYMCTKPLHALGDFGKWVYGKGAPLLYHQYICVKNGQTTVCGGQDRTGRPYSRGKPSDPNYDVFNPNTCEKKADSPCMEKCLIQAIQNPERPYYGLIGPGTNCQEWANDTYSRCLAQCNRLEY